MNHHCRRTMGIFDTKRKCCDHCPTFDVFYVKQYIWSYADATMSSKFGEVILKLTMNALCFLIFLILLSLFSVIIRLSTRLHLCSLGLDDALICLAFVCPTVSAEIMPKSVLTIYSGNELYSLLLWHSRFVAHDMDQYKIWNSANSRKAELQSRKNTSQAPDDFFVCFKISLGLRIMTSSF